MISQNASFCSLPRVCSADKCLHCPSDLMNSSVHGIFQMLMTSFPILTDLPYSWTKLIYQLIGHKIKSSLEQSSNGQIVVVWISNALLPRPKAERVQDHPRIAFVPGSNEVLRNGYDRDTEVILKSHWLHLEFSSFQHQNKEMSKDSSLDGRNSWIM